MWKLGIVLAGAVLMSASPCFAASREYQACLYLTKKQAVAPDTLEVVDSTDFTAVGKSVIEISIKAIGINMKEYRSATRCVFSDIGSSPVQLVSFEMDHDKWSGEKAELYRDYLKIGGF